MKINKDVENALVVCMHLSTNGKSTIKSIADKFELSEEFLQQICRKLRRHGVLKVYRGPHGGVELIEGIRVVDVLTAMGKTGFASKINPGGRVEYAALSSLFQNMWIELNPYLTVSIDSLAKNSKVEAWFI